MADDKTRVETVTENLEAVVSQRGEESYNQITVQLLKDINLSLAMLVDGSAGT